MQGTYDLATHLCARLRVTHG
ncbi:hypothetical protein F383_31804 [Gossypium arboreum]|uniref:Uncharacterized protein n=1 Tax=Gossypium arboreum TaxID=29729 RepID=A0A0B0PLH7_GOSAR|nr:hypothetical protein F383_31804 [Gossypium arboreum]